MIRSIWPCLLICIGCANLRPPTVIDGHPVAYDSMASGNVKASAIKKIEAQDVCFDISISLVAPNQLAALPRNWSLAWVDKKNQYHLLSLNQRNPASTPKGGHTIPRFGQRDEWTNEFRTCASKAELDDVKGIVLTPKELPFDDKRSLRLNWE
jgi:hypothetical protein